MCMINKYLPFILFVFIALLNVKCSKTTFSDFNKTSGKADFSNYISVGNSITQGYQDQGLYEGFMRLVTGGGNAGLAVSMLVSEGSILPGDINGDETVNIQDIIFLVNFILNVDEPDAGQFNAADVNNDDTLNVQDIILIINLILA